MADKTYRVTTQVSDGYTTKSSVIEETGEAHYQDDIAVTANQTNKEVDIGFRYQGVKLLLILPTFTGTLKTNTTGGTDTINFTAGQAFIYRDGVDVNPFSADVTKFYLNNSDNAVGTATVWILMDSTP